MIGVFDSGFGGLHVLKSVTTRHPSYGYIYLGDSARAPYGPRTQGEVYAFTKQGVEFLFSRGARLVVLACNTASSEALRKIQMEYLEKKINKKVLGVLIPFSETAVAVTKNNRVGVMATLGTVRSGAFVREITKLGKVEVFQQDCPGLVPLLEAGKQDSAELVQYIEEYVAPLLAQDIDTLVLGCTHYGIVREKIQKAVGERVRIVAGRDVMPEALADYLERHPEIEQTIARNVPPRFYTTGEVAHFSKLGSIFFGTDIRAEKVTLGL